MPTNLDVVFGVLAAVCLLIWLTGGAAKLFGADLPVVKEWWARAVAGVLVFVFVGLALMVHFIPPLGQSGGNTGGGTTNSGTTSTNGTVPPGGPDATSQVLKAFNSFCQALHANQLDAAFNDLTPGFQQSVGSSGDLPNVVGGTFGTNQETATDCSVFSPPSIKPDGQGAVELGNVVVTDSTFGTHTIARNFEFVHTNGKWLINNIYAQ